LDYLAEYNENSKVIQINENNAFHLKNFLSEF
jgi:hypothetical protein